jgi:predicted amidohydrolase
VANGCLQIASCQFAVSEDIEANAEAIFRLMEQAAQSKADIAHFSECALSGYAGADFSSFEDLDWPLLREKTQAILALARKLKLWVALGSTHPLTAPNKPHNCMYLINPQGQIADRYDKRFCTEGDLMHYTPGDHFSIFDLHGVKCALLICFDLRFPEIYRALCKEGVQCIFQSFYNARQMEPSVHTHIMRQTMQANAATNHFWVSMTNACGWFCPYPSCFIQPDGKIVGQMEEHKEGLIINCVDTSQTFYDPSAPFRDLAIGGALTNGPGEIRDPRSQSRTDL